MSDLVRLTLALATSAVKAVVRFWLGADWNPNESTESLLGTRVTGLDQRRLERRLSELVDVINEMMMHIVSTSGLAENERIAATQMAVDTLADANLSGFDVLAVGETGSGLREYLTASRVVTLDLMSLSPTAAELYSNLLDHACATIVSIASALPRFSANAMGSLLLGLDEQRDELEKLLVHLPRSTPEVETAENTYRRLLVHKLNRIELFGVDLPDQVRFVPLMDAYTPLAAVVAGRKMSSELVIADHRRVLVVGDAGSGKTTLLAWLAVNAARGSSAGPLKPLNDMLPLYLPLRRLMQRVLPSRRSLLDVVASATNDPTAPGQLHDRFRSGRALLLIDGVDEVDARYRAMVHGWLSGLVSTYPDVRYVCTTRPSAVSSDWLHDAKFTRAELLPLDSVGVSTLVQQWFHAALPESKDHDKADSLAQRLLTALNEQPQLNSLASSPLLCALICANSVNRATVPVRRTELYSMFVETLIDRRDRERAVDDGPLGRAEKLLLLRKLAWWLVDHGQSEMDTSTALALIDEVRPQLGHNDSSEIYRQLLNRTGLLREPAQNRLQFIHQSFQEYLAAQEAAEENRIAGLVARAHEPQWQDVLALSAAHCSVRQTDSLLRGVLSRCQDEPDHRLELLRTAERYLANAYLVNPELREDVLQLNLSLTKDDLQRDALVRLVDSLLEIPCMSEVGGRRAVVEMLPRGRAVEIASHSSPRLQVQHIVRSCLQHDDGLAELLAVIRLLNGDSAAIHRLNRITKDLVARIRPDDCPPQFAAPPDPGQARNLDDLVRRLWLLKTWAGSPSYQAIAEQVNILWRATGRPDGEWRAAKNTVAACFTSRPRPNDDVLLAIVAVLNPDDSYVAQWRQALRVVRGESKAATFIQARNTRPADTVEFIDRETELSRPGIAYAQIGQYQQATNYFLQALASCRDLGDPAGQAQALTNLGVVSCQLGHYQDSLEYQERARAIFHEIDDRLKEGQALINLGIVSNLLHRYDEALPYYESALAIAREIGDRGGEGIALGNLGVTLNLLGRREEALQRQLQRLAIVREVGDRAGEGITLDILGGICRLLGRYTHALRYLQEALAIFRDIDDPAGEVSALNGLGNVCNQTGRHSEGLDHHRSAAVIARAIDHHEGLANALNGLGTSAGLLNLHMDAITYHQEGLAQSEERGDRFAQAHAHYGIAQSVLTLGNRDLALTHLQAAFSLSIDLDLPEADAIAAQLQELDQQDGPDFS